MIEKNCNLSSVIQAQNFFYVLPKFVYIKLSTYQAFFNTLSKIFALFVILLDFNLITHYLPSILLSFLIQAQTLVVAIQSLWSNLAALFSQKNSFLFYIFDVPSILNQILADVIVLEISQIQFDFYRMIIICITKNNNNSLCYYYIIIIILLLLQKELLV